MNLLYIQWIQIYFNVHLCYLRSPPGTVSSLYYLLLLLLQVPRKRVHLMTCAHCDTAFKRLSFFECLFVQAELFEMDMQLNKLVGAM